MDLIGFLEGVFEGATLIIRLFRYRQQVVRRYRKIHRPNSREAFTRDVVNASKNIRTRSNVPPPPRPTPTKKKKDKEQNVNPVYRSYVVDTPIQLVTIDFPDITTPNPIQVRRKTDDDFNFRSLLMTEMELEKNGFNVYWTNTRELNKTVIEISKHGIEKQQKYSLKLQYWQIELKLKQLAREIEHEKKTKLPPPPPVRRGRNV